MRLLLVKLSSLGDVVHALPAVTDAARALPGLEVHWVVEEGYQAIPALHGAVTKVIPVAIRRWRGQWRGAGREIGDFVRDIRTETYDVVLDSQGLIKSAVVARFGRGRHVGFDAASARERVASLGYRCGVAVEPQQHAIDRQRALFAGALGYPMPTDAIDYGLRVQRNDASGLVLAHGTTWTNKRWPERFWAELATRALSRGERVTLPWGNPDEEARARRIAALAPGAEVAARLDLRGMIDLLASAASCGERRLRHRSPGFGARCANACALRTYRRRPHRLPRRIGHESVGAVRVRAVPRTAVRLPRRAGVRRCAAHRTAVLLHDHAGTRVANAV